MDYETVPQSVASNPTLLEQYVHGNLAGVRDIPDSAENLRQLVEMVEHGVLSQESIRDIDADLGARVGAEVQRHHAEMVAVTKAQALADADEGVAQVLAGIDDVDAALASLTKDGSEPPTYRLVSDELYVSGMSSEAIATALRETRP